MKFICVAHVANVNLVFCIDDDELDVWCPFTWLTGTFVVFRQKSYVRLHIGYPLRNFTHSTSGNPNRNPNAEPNYNLSISRVTRPGSRSRKKETPGCLQCINTVDLRMLKMLDSWLTSVWTLTVKRSKIARVCCRDIWWRLSSHSRHQQLQFRSVLPVKWVSFMQCCQCCMQSCSIKTVGYCMHVF